jgi:bifunctional non-homologous end joining protein LigD
MKSVDAQLRAIEKNGGEGTVNFGGGKTLDVSHLNKEYFPEAKYTKGDVMRYYAAVAPYILPRIKDRPLVLKRFPDGVGKPPFYQQNAPRDTPRAVRVAEVKSSKGASRRIIGGDLPTLLYTVQLGAIDVHPWLSRLKTLRYADFAVLDLDPGKGVGFEKVIGVARWIGEYLKKAKYPALIKTSGSRGIHIFVPMPPRTTYEKAQQFARTIAEETAEEHPKEATIQRMIAKRPRDTVYVDFLQNAEGKSVAAPFSLRANSGAMVSMPIAWNELTVSLYLDAFTIVTGAAQAKKRARYWKID